MKILLIYSKEGKIEGHAQSLRQGIEAAGHQVTVKTPDNTGQVITCHPYDLLIVGSPIVGVWGGKFAEDLKAFLSEVKRTEGQEAIAFTDRKILGTDKGLRLLMGMMESQGCIVKNFRAFRSSKEALEFGQQI